MKNTEFAPLQIEDKIITIREQNVMLDVAVAEIYGVDTDNVTQAVRRNPDKFPEGYVFELTPAEKRKVVENPITRSENGVTTNCGNIHSTLSMAYLEKIKRSPTLPKAFTEKGLYMLATILKSQRATDATLEIVEAFAKMRELSRNIAMLTTIESEVIEPEIIESTGGLIKDLFFSHFPTTSSETSLEFNVGVVKGKRTIKSENPDIQKRFDELERMILDLKDQIKT
jgi:hypothetical protein